MKFIQVKYPAKQYVKAVSLTGSSNNFFLSYHAKKKKLMLCFVVIIILFKMETCEHSCFCCSHLSESGDDICSSATMDRPISGDGFALRHLCELLSCLPCQPAFPNMISKAPGQPESGLTRGLRLCE